MGSARQKWEIGDVLARTDLARLLDEVTVAATHTMRNRRWHCPIASHDDHHASVTVHTDHRGHERWRCWSGDDTHRGDAIDLVVATQHVSRADAIAWLANRAGMVPDQPLPPVRSRPRPTAPQDATLDPAVIRYVGACEKILWGHVGAPVRNWLYQRGFDDDLLRANHVGADPGLTMLPRLRGLPHGHSLAATFPALDPDGNVAYVQARYLQPHGSDKYDNPAGRLGANPRLAWTRTANGRQVPGVLVITEGIPDALTAAAGGYASVGVLGSQAPDERVARVLSHRAVATGCDLVAIVDADPAGRAWGERLGGLLADLGTELTLAEPPDSLDLNEWARLDRSWWRLAPLPTSGVAIEASSLIAAEAHRAVLS